MHEAVVAYFKGSECGFREHICSLRRYPDYKHILCPLCLSINSRWPPPPKDPPPPEKNPDLIYPGDIDPEFRPTRGDILVANPAIGPSLRKLGFRGSCVVSYDGSPEFQFVIGDVVVRIGAYEVTIVEPPPKVEEKKGKHKAPPAKARGEKKNEKEPGPKGGGKGAVARGAVIEAETAPDPDKPVDLVTYKPYERVEVYYYTRDDQWKFMGRQENLEMKNKVLLQTQCPGLTAFYRYYKAGTKLLPHTLAPCLGEIVLPEWIWQEDFDHKANKWRAAGRWYRPDIPDRTRLRPGMILLRPLVGQLKAESSTLLNVVEMERAKKLEEAKAKELADQVLLEKFLAMEKANAEAAAAAVSEEKDDKKKGTKGKKDNDKEDKKTKDDMKKKKDDKEEEKNGKKKKDDDKKTGGKKDDGQKETKKGGKKGTRVEEKVEETPPEAPLPPNNNEFLKLAKWGAVELYRFEIEEGDAQTWTYYGRSNRIYDTAYSLPSETTKLKFVHEDDRAQIVEVLPEELPPEPEPDVKYIKGKKGKKGDKEEKFKKKVVTGRKEAGGGDKDKKKP